MYTLTFIFDDYRTYKVEVDTFEAAELLLDNVKESKLYTEENNSVGVWVPVTKLRCVYIQKVQNPESQPCQSPPVLEVESASPN